MEQKENEEIKKSKSKTKISKENKHKGSYVSSRQT